MQIACRGMFWNTIGSIAFAANSMLLLLVVTRNLGVAAAGDFGIAFTTAQILYIIGLFGINHFQMTDFNEQYSFSTYKKAKLASSVLMMLLCVAISVFYFKTTNEIILLFILTLYMMVHSIAELYQSMFFQHKRLDMSGKSLFYRTTCSLVCFGVLMYFTRNLYFSSVCMMLTNAATLHFFCILPSKSMLSPPKADNNCSLQDLLRETFPLFISLLMMNVISNMSKYFINFYCDSTTQGYFNIIFIPAMVINLLSSSVFRPLLSTYSKEIEDGNVKRFRKMLFQQTGFIVGFTVICCVGCYFLGTQVLGWFYKIDLTALRFELTAVVFGGGFIAMASLLYYLLIILRKQTYISLGYVFALIVGSGLSLFMTKIMGIKGGVLSFVSTHAFLVAIFLGIILISTRGDNDVKSDGCNNHIQP